MKRRPGKGYMGPALCGKQAWQRVLAQSENYLPQLMCMEIIRYRTNNAQL